MNNILVFVHNFQAFVHFLCIYERFLDQFGEATLLRESYVGFVAEVDDLFGPLSAGDDDDVVVNEIRRQIIFELLYARVWVEAMKAQMLKRTLLQQSVFHFKRINPNNLVEAVAISLFAPLVDQDLQLIRDLFFFVLVRLRLSKVVHAVEVISHEYVVPSSFKSQRSGILAFAKNVPRYSLIACDVPCLHGGASNAPLDQKAIDYLESNFITFSHIFELISLIPQGLKTCLYFRFFHLFSIFDSAESIHFDQSCAFQQISLHDGEY